MDDLNISTTTPLQNSIENTPTGKPTSKLPYIITGILFIGLAASLFFVNTNYQKTQVLGIETMKLSADIIMKDNLIASLNTNITNLNTEIQKLNEKVAGLELTTGGITDITTTSIAESDPVKSRDNARISGIKEISILLRGYMIDLSVYPIALKSGCIPEEDMKKSSRSKIPVDPIERRYSSGCTEFDTMTYAYRTINSNDGMAFVIIAAELESELGGNSALSIDEIMSLEDPLTHVLNLKQGSGRYYIVAN